MAALLCSMASQSPGFACMTLSCCSRKGPHKASSHRGDTGSEDGLPKQCLLWQPAELTTALTKVGWGPGSIPRGMDSGDPGGQ